MIARSESNEIVRRYGHVRPELTQQSDDPPNSGRCDETERTVTTVSFRGQLRPNAAMTTDNVVTFGAGYHGACSGELTGCQAVPPQRAIEVGNFLGNSKSPTTLRL